MTKNVISVVCLDDGRLEQATECADRLGIKLGGGPGADYSLVFSRERVSLRNGLKPKVGDIYVDFCRGAAAHRRKFGGGAGQLVARACGIAGQCKPSIFDATAGLGQDAFVLASLGCKVTLMERSPVAYYLLQDGINRAKVEALLQPELLDIINRMTLVEGNSITHFEEVTTPIAGVVYLDPMFPAKQKNAMVKKEMSAFHDLIGADADESRLLESALRVAEYRVVVKRPRLADPIAGVSPSVSHAGKSSRFDVYGLKRLHS